MEYISKECHDKIVAELNQLIDVEYPKIKDALSEARAQGDLSENFEYRAARRAQGKMISRIKYLQRTLEYTRIVDSTMLNKSTVGLLSTVEFTNLDTNAKMKFTLVSPHEANFQEGKLSIMTPIAQALMGKKAGDIVEAHVPAGTLRLRIEKTNVTENAVDSKVK